MAGLSRDAVVVVNAGREGSGSFIVSVTGTEFSISGLAPGASAERPFDCRYGILTAPADATDAIDGSDEQNNGLTVNGPTVRSRI